MRTRLLLADERAPEHADSLADHAHLELVLAYEPVNDLSERRVAAEFEPVPECPLDTIVLVLLGCNRLGEAEERQRDVQERIPVVVNLGLAVDELANGQTGMSIWDKPLQSGRKKQTL